MPHLEQWALVSKNPYQAPEARIPSLQGIVTGHPRFEDGDPITTSLLDRFDSATEEFVTFSGTRYTLGEPHEDYEKLFPDAKTRLIEQGWREFGTIIEQKGVTRNEQRN